MQQILLTMDHRHRLLVLALVLRCNPRQVFQLLPPIQDGPIELGDVLIPIWKIAVRYASSMTRSESNAGRRFDLGWSQQLCHGGPKRTETTAASRFETRWQPDKR